MGAPNLVPTPNTHDPNSIIRAIMRLSSLALGSGSTPTFASLTLSGLTANRLIYTNGDNKLTSVSNLSSWVAGTADEIDVADDGDGTITLSLAAGASGTLDHNDLINTHNLTTDIDHDALTNFVANEHIDWTGATQDFLTSGFGTINGLIPGADDTYDLGKEELVGGGEELKISQPNYGGVGGELIDFTSKWRGNSFTPGEDMFVSKIVVRLFRSGVPTTATLYVTETTAGKPSGVPLTSKTVDVSGITSNSAGELVEFAFDAAVNLTSGVMYAWYCISAIGGVKILGSSSNEYADGTHIWTNDGGATWGTTAGWDQVFYIYTETSSTEYTRWQDLYLSGSLKDGTNSLTIANLQSAYDHIHNLTTDIDHDALTNFVANEHIDWTSTSQDFSTSGTLGSGNATIDGTFTVNSPATATNVLFVNRSAATGSIFRIREDAAGGGIMSFSDESAEAIGFNSRGSSWIKKTLSLGENVADAKFTSNQESATGAMPTIRMVQADVDYAFVDYEGTTEAGASKSLTSWTTGNSIQGFAKIKINGADHWMPFYDAPTS